MKGSTHWLATSPFHLKLPKVASFRSVLPVWGQHYKPRYQKSYSIQEVLKEGQKPCLKWAYTTWVLYWGF